MEAEKLGYGFERYFQTTANRSQMTITCRERIRGMCHATLSLHTDKPALAAF